MIKTKNLLFCILTSLILCFTVMIPVHADSELDYEGVTAGFNGGGSEYTDTDFFDELKNAMPGDHLTQNVSVVNKASDCDYIKVYMKAVPHDDSSNPMSENVAENEETVGRMQDFLNQLSMKILNSDEVIYQDTPDQTGQLSEYVYLGTLRKGESLDLTVNLDVPLDLSNEYADRVGEVDWIFLAEYFNDEKQATPTGYEGEITLYGMLAAVSLFCLGFAAKKRFEH